MWFIKRKNWSSQKTKVQALKVGEEVFTPNSDTLIENKNFELNFLEIDDSKPSRPSGEPFNSDNFDQWNEKTLFHEANRKKSSIFF